MTFLIKLNNCHCFVNMASINKNNVIFKCLTINDSLNVYKNYLISYDRWRKQEMSFKNNKKN